MSAPLSISVRDLYVDYEIFEDRRAALRERVVKHQGTGRRVVRALKGVSFDITAGEAVGVIGANGSGKSTLLAALAGLLPPTSGEILVASEPKLLGVGATLLPKATGWRNIRIGCMALGMTADEVEGKIGAIADFTELGEALERPLRTYSSGMRARLHFAIATSVQPKILLIDEALAVGDRAFRNKAADRINDLLAGAGTLLLVTHSLGEIRKRCDRVLWIDKGRLRADGKPATVIKKYKAAVGGPAKPGKGKVKAKAKGKGKGKQLKAEGRRQLARQATDGSPTGRGQSQTAGEQSGRGRRRQPDEARRRQRQQGPGDGDHAREGHGGPRQARRVRLDEPQAPHGQPSEDRGDDDLPERLPVQETRTSG